MSAFRATHSSQFGGFEIARQLWGISPPPLSQFRPSTEKPSTRGNSTDTISSPYQLPYQRKEATFP